MGFLVPQACSGYTHQHQPTAGWICGLKSCLDESGAPTTDCLTTPRPNSTVQSALLDGTRPDPVVTSAAITVGSDVRLENFTLLVSNKTLVAEFAAVYMPAASQRLVVRGLGIVMQQRNVSNAFKLFGSQFELADNVARQEGSCMWPAYGPGSDATPFQASVTIQMMGAVDGWVHSNAWFWRCSFMDMDVSDRIVFEDNTIVDTEPHIPPHGNSISGYNFPHHPSSRWWSFARNSMVRAHRAKLLQNHYVHAYSTC